MLIVPVKLEMVEDLRQDMKDDPGLDFGGCADIECLENTCFGVHLIIDKTKYVLFMCKDHMERICKDFGYTAETFIQNKLDV